MTVVRTMELGRALAQNAAKVEAQIKAVEKEAKERKISAHDMRDQQGNWVLTPLLVAQAQTLHAITLLNERERRR